MGRYAAKRLLLAVPTLFGLSILVFALGSRTLDPSERLASAGLLPGQEPTAQQIAKVHHQLGLDQPVVVRYGHWLGRAVHGDFGQSLFVPIKVSDEIGRAFPATIALAVSALFLVVALAIPMGVVSAMFHGSWADTGLRALALAGASVPGFFLAYLLVYVFSVRLHLLPVAGTVGVRSIVLPAFTLAAGPAALVSRLLRSTLLEVLGEDYIRTARAKGLATVPVVVNHALRNASAPVLTVLGTTIGRMLEGTVIVEVIFSRQGIGSLTFGAITSADYPVVQGVVLFAGAVFVLVNLLVDLSYPLIDPRVRLGAAG